MVTSHLLVLGERHILCCFCTPYCYAALILLFAFLLISTLYLYYPDLVRALPENVFLLSDVHRIILSYRF
jgi:hypothetical protein